MTHARTRTGALGHLGLVGLVGLVCLAAACSSGSKTPATTTSTSTTLPLPSTTTTPAVPPPATVTAVKAYFNGPAAVIIRFEKATKFLTRGVTPSMATCKNLVKVALPKIAKQPETLINIATATPDTVLVRALRRDISDKFFMVSGCYKHPVNAVFARDIAKNAKVLFARFKVYGYVI